MNKTTIGIILFSIGVSPIVIGSIIELLEYYSVFVVIGVVLSVLFIFSGCLLILTDRGE